jgi:putative transposase
MPWTKPYDPAHNQRLAADMYAYANRVYFMTIRAYLHQSPFVRDLMNKMIIDTLRDEQSPESCTVFTYCLLPDHLHFLISPQHDGISVLDFVDRFKGRTTNRSWRLGWRGKLWQPRSYDHVVRAGEDLSAIAPYILNTPVRKGLVSSAEEWTWGGQMNPLPL